MTRRLAIIETYWYWAYQDGPASNVKYNTKEEAEKALKGVLKELRKKHKGLVRDICVMSCTHEVEP